MVFKMESIEKRKTKDGKAIFRAQVRLKGFPEQNASFERLTDAKRWAQQIESAIFSIFCWIDYFFPR